jgi:hypothetical protein
MSTDHWSTLSVNLFFSHTLHGGSGEEAKEAAREAARRAAAHLNDLLSKPVEAGRALKRTLSLASRLSTSAGQPQRVVTALLNAAVNQEGIWQDEQALAIDAMGRLLST